MDGRIMKWFHEPRKWTLTKNQLIINTEPVTDFWRTTFYGYVTDNGHFYYQDQTGDFEAKVKIVGGYRDLYDQAGLMIRIDSTNWIKSGAEFVNGTVHISAVFTRQFSDWSVITLVDSPEAIWLKLVRKNDSIELSYSLNGIAYTLQRLGYFPSKVKVQIGLMAASPTGKGFGVTFENFEITKL